MLKGRKNRLISIFVVTGLIIGSFTVFAKQSEEIIKILYSDIKIMIDGVEFQPKDANGYPVEPFIYNGTTYLPVRGIANAFGSEVNWDPETMTVSLGSSKFDWLEQMGYVDYYRDSNNDNFSLYSDENYSKGVKFNLTLDGVGDIYKDLKLGDIAKQKVTYQVAKKYSKFLTTLYSSGSEPVTIKIYGDNNKLLYASPGINKDIKPVDISVDVSNNNFLYFEISGTIAWKNAHGGKMIFGSAILGNARFSIAE